MYKNYLSNEKLKKYLTTEISKMTVDDTYKPLLVDILMRRAYEYELSEDDIKQDVTSLINSLVEIRKVRNDQSKGWVSRYLPDKKVIELGEYSSNSINSFYSTLTHEVYHALSRDENDEDRLSSINMYSDMYNITLLEAIIEKAAHRTVYNENIGENPYYNNNSEGYNEMTFLVDMLEAIYGVKEKDFLKNAIMGRDRLIEFLSKSVNESKEETTEFLDKFELVASALHQTLYPYVIHIEDKRERNENIAGAFLGITIISMKKMLDLVENRLKINNDEKSIEDIKFSYNKFNSIINDRTEKMAKKYKSPLLYLKIINRSRDMINNSFAAISKLIDQNEPQKPKRNIKTFVKDLKEKKFSIKEILKESVLFEKKMFNIEENVIARNSTPPLGTDGEWNNEEVINQLRNIKGEKEEFFESISQIIKDMEIDGEYKPFIEDILMRRAYGMKREHEDIIRDAQIIRENVKQIKVEENEEIVDYESNSKTITIAKAARWMGKESIYAKFTKKMYEILYSEEKNNKDEKLSEFEKVICECAAYRAVYNRNNNTDIFLNDNYINSDLTEFVIDAICTVYDTTENDFLQNAIDGKEKLIEFLSDRHSERKESTKIFIDFIEENLKELSKNVYDNPEENARTNDERKKNIQDAMTNIYIGCYAKLNSLFDSSYNYGLELDEDQYDLFFEAFTKYNEVKQAKLNNILKITASRLDRFCKHKAISRNIIDRTKYVRNSMSEKISDIRQIIKKTSKKEEYQGYKKKELLKNIKDGTFRSNCREDIRKLRIRLKSPFLIKLSTHDAMRHTGLPAWYNFWGDKNKITEFSKLIKLKVKELKVLKRKGIKALPQTEENLTYPNISESLKPLSEEELKKFNEQAKKVVGEHFEKKDDLQTKNEDTQNFDK